MIRRYLVPGDIVTSEELMEMQSPALVSEAMYWDPCEYAPLVGKGWYESEPGVWRRTFIEEQPDAS